MDISPTNKIENYYASSPEESRGEYIGSLGNTENSKANQSKPADTVKWILLNLKSMLLWDILIALWHT